MAGLKYLIREYVLAPKLYRGLRHYKRGKLGKLFLGKSDDSSAWDEYESSRWALLRSSLTGARRYLEFGCGLSTQFVARNYECQIRSVETDKTYSSEIQNILRERAEIFHIDLGPVGPWGRPTGYSRRGMFEEYLEVGFSKSYSPDVVLIDGRFRVAAFLTAVLRSAPGTHIVFDDYPGRPQYHVVEEVLTPDETSADQAKFVRPEKIDDSEVLRLRNLFLHVMD